MSRLTIRTAYKIVHKSDFSLQSFGQGTENTPPQKVHGKPWMFVLRDVLQYANNGEEGVSRIQSTYNSPYIIR